MSGSLPGDPGRGAASHSRDLEAARGLAILLVVLLHYTPYFFEPEWLQSVLGPLAFVPRAGFTGVVLFFVLSSFLLSRPFLREWMGSAPRPSVSHFAYRRALRILPLFYFAVLVAYVSVGGGQAAFRSLLFLDDGVRLRPFSGVWWSLRTEVQFYLLLGISVLVLRDTRLRAPYVALLAAFMAGSVAFLFGAFSSLQWTAASVPLNALLSFACQWPAFVFGAAVAWLHLRWGQRWAAATRRSAFLRRGGADLLLLSVLVALGAALHEIATITYFERLRTQPAWLIPDAALWAAFVLGLLVLPLRARWLLVNPVMEFLGRISYSLYLVHVPFQRLTGTLRFELHLRLFGFVPQSPFTATFAFGVLLLSAIAVSWLTYVSIEKPFLRFKSRVS